MPASVSPRERRFDCSRNNSHALQGIAVAPDQTALRSTGVIYPLLMWMVGRLLRRGFMAARGAGWQA